jgi:hypothetical protein
MRIVADRAPFLTTSCRRLHSARGLDFVKLLNKRFSFHFFDFASNNDPDAPCYPSIQRSYRDPTIALCSCCATGGMYTHLDMYQIEAFHTSDIYD